MDFNEDVSWWGFTRKKDLIKLPPGYEFEEKEDGEGVYYVIRGSKEMVREILEGAAK